MCGPRIPCSICLRFNRTEGWGILRGNDPFLYGEKLKAYLIAGTKPIASESEYPNRRVGWGRLCLESSLPD